jgi:hypothetical protein
MYPGRNTDAFWRALALNTTIKTLSLPKLHLPFDRAQVIWEALCENKTIENLILHNCSFDYFPLPVWKGVVRVIRNNPNLKKVDIGKDPSLVPDTWRIVLADLQTFINNPPLATCSIILPSDFYDDKVGAIERYNASATRVTLLRSN